MTPERWQQVKLLYHAVQEAEPSDRGALLDSADPDVRREVESLLSSEDSGASPLDRDLWSESNTLVDDQTETLTQLGESVNLGQYQVQTLLGRGGMGEVYLAHDRKLGRDVAIKTLPKEFSDDPERLSRFRREARVLASLNHPNIAAIYGLDESAGLNFLILELVEGETLAQRLKRIGPIPVDEALRVMCQVAEALEAAHCKGITHRDIKPANIKVTSEGRVKVLDFGLAKVLRTTTTAPQRKSAGVSLDTGHGRILGTPRYMSPEQARGQEVDQRTDIWAFGCVVFELLTAKPALDGRTVSDIIAAILDRDPDYQSLPASTPLQVRRLIHQCLTKDASKRLSDIGDARRAIASAQAHPRMPTFRRRTLVTSGAAAAAAAVPLAFNAGGLRDRWFAGGPRFRSIAVLPLTNVSGDPDQEYFSDGMTESLIANLAKIGALKVISRTSVMTYKGTKKPLREIAEELRVDAVLEGSTIRTGNRIRITAKLIDAKTDQHLWAESFDGDLGGALMLQNEVARAVAQQVRAQLTPLEQTRLASARRVDPGAYEAYLKGTFYQNTTREGLDKAKRYYDLALEKDSDSALAYAGIARVWASRQQFGFAAPQEAGPRLVEAAEKALARDGGLAEVHYTLAVMKGWTLWDFKEAEASFQRAIDLNPSYPDARVLYARLLNILGRPEEAMPQIERALELDPHNSFFRGMYAVDLCWVGRYDKAIEVARRVLAEDPNQLQAEAALRSAFEAKGMLKEALEIQITRMKRDRELAQVLQRGYDEGTYREAARAGAELLEARSRSGTFVPAARIAVFFQLAGLPDKVLEWLEKGVEQRDPNVLGGLGHIRRGLPMLAENPRFKTMLQRAGLPLR